MPLSVSIAKTAEQRQTCYRLRHAVFVEEQSVPVELEIDEHDETDAIHFLGAVNGEPVATARLVVKAGTAKIGRLVVSRQQRGAGYGAAMVKHLLSHIRCHDLAPVAALDAQIQATAFYEALGFRQQGDKFLDAGIVHVRMVNSMTR